MNCSSRRILLLTVFLSVIFFIVSLILGFIIFPEQINSEVNKMVKLEVQTDQYDEFVQPASPGYFRIYLFNIMNADDILHNSAKPNVTQVGPFVYRHYRHKSIIYSDSDEDSITYTQTGTFQFDAQKSFPLTDDVEITILNLPMMYMYQIAESEDTARIVDQCIQNVFPDKGNIFIKIKVKEVLFDGFDFCVTQSDPVCSFANNYICSLVPSTRNIMLLEDKSLQFSYFKYKQHSQDGKYAIKRGLNNINTLGEIIRWNDLKYTGYWGDNTVCSEVKGTDSTLHPPHVTKNNSFFIFSTDICRYLELSYANDAIYQEINGYSFVLDSMSLYSNEENLEDDCFCVEQTVGAAGQRSCFMNGVINLQTCNGIPVLLSFPHFLWAHYNYTATIDGLYPEEELHKTFVILEPNTGIPIKNVKRTQLNFHIRPIKDAKSTNNLSNVILPLLWTEEDLTPGNSTLRRLKKEYFERVEFFESLKWGLTASSATMVILFLIVLIHKKYYKN